MIIRQNMHVHSRLSLCAAEEMTLPGILAEAERASLEWIGLCDHIDVPDATRYQEVLGNISVVSSIESPVKVLVGSEATMIAPDLMAVSDEVAAALDYVMVAVNHYHLGHVENPLDRSPQGYADHYLRMLESAVTWEYASIIAHPFWHAKVRDMDHAQVLASYDLATLERVLRKAAEHRVAFELNPGHVRQAVGFFKDIVQFGQPIGLTFALGTDAHRLENISYSVDGGWGPEQMAQELGLRTEDLFQPEDLQRR